MLIILVHGVSLLIVGRFLGRRPTRRPRTPLRPTAPQEEFRLWCALGCCVTQRLKVGPPASPTTVKLLPLEATTNFFLGLKERSPVLWELP